METIRPFQGIYYNREKVQIERVVTQPYDKIDPRLHQEYLERSGHNAVRLILKEDRSVEGLEASSYSAQAKLFEEWLGAGIFLKGEGEALYGYTQEFQAMGQKRKRHAFIGLGRLHGYDQKRVFPHEETLAKPRQDRLNHLSATRTQFGLIFMLYEDARHEVSNLIRRFERENVLFDFTDLDDGVHHSLWALRDRAALERVQELMRDRRLLIADGHHRYETALAFQDRMRRQFSGESGTLPFDYAMMAFVNLYDEGLVILPTHRLVRHVSDERMVNLTNLLRKEFKIERVKLPAESREIFIREKMRPDPLDHPLIGLYTGSDDFLLLHYLQKVIPQSRFEASHSEKWRGLDVNVLHALVLRQILGIDEEAVRSESHLSYCRGVDQALEAVRQDRAQLAFLLNPVRPEVVRDIAFASERMPQKSTDFYPKLLTGLMLRQV